VALVLIVSQDFPKKTLSPGPIDKTPLLSVGSAAAFPLIYGTKSQNLKASF